jgi:ABC-type amino acid transport substrate-binding protein
LLADQLSVEPYAIVLPRGDAAFRLAVNSGLARIYAGDEIAEIFRRWFGALGRPSAVVEAAYLLGAIPE